MKRFLLMLLVVLTLFNLLTACNNESEDLTEYKITCMIDGVVWDSVYVKDNEIINLNSDVLTKSGYHFDGWYLNDKKVDGAVFNYKNDVVVNAKFSPNKATIIYKLWISPSGEGDIVVGEMPNQIIKTGEKLNKNAFTTLVDCTFLGWALTPYNGESEFPLKYKDEEIIVIENDNEVITLYANYEPIWIG